MNAFLFWLHLTVQAAEGPVSPKQYVTDADYFSKAYRLTAFTVQAS